MKLIQIFTFFCFKWTFKRIFGKSLKLGESIPQFSLKKLQS